MSLHDVSKDKPQPQSEQQSLVSDPASLSISFQSTNPNSFTRRLWKWTGFGEKNLLELLQIATSIAAAIAIPFVLNSINQQQEQTAIDTKEREIEIAQDNQRHQILSGYFDQMTNLLLENKSGDSNVSNEVKLIIARSRTLNTLPQLDGNRKAQLLKFLYEARLLGGHCQIDLREFIVSQCQESILKLQDAIFDETKFERPFPLQGIDLSSASLAEAELVGIDLTQAKMQNVNLERANLTQATLIDAQMEKSILNSAQLIDARLNRANLSTSLLRNINLSGANLEDAVLEGANLQGANLDKANLKNADLRNADFTNASLQDTTLNGAIYNDATDFPSGFNRQGQGMRYQP